MGVGLLLIMRYRPKGILPEKNRNKNKIMKYIILGAALAWTMYMADKYLF